jgi:rare lipoprotein A
MDGIERRQAGRRGGAIGLLCVAALVSACSSAPPRPSPRDARPPSTDTRPPSTDAARARPPSRSAATATPLPTNPRGGYYGDDGPPDAPPVDLASVPDAQPRLEPLSTRANRPYVVFGQSYVPMARLAPYRERGVASWYGRKFHGQPTSIGESYDMYSMTAAHPTLPIPSYARVTHLRNGRSVVVRVNDRGPFLNGRLIDLSYAAAVRLGYANAGSAEVEVELIQPDQIESFGLLQASAAPAALPPASPASPAVGAQRPALAQPAPAQPASPPPAAAAPEPIERLVVETVVLAPSAAAAPAGAAPPVASPAVAAPVAAPSALPPSAGPALSAPLAVAGSGGTWLQLAAFSSRDNAEAARARLARALEWLAAPIELVEDRGMFKVRAGPLAPAAARDAIDRIGQATRTRPFAVSR